MEEIQEIQLDHTSRCNLECPQCARTTKGWASLPQNKNLDLSLDDYKILLEPFPRNKLKVFHCGNFGDALASPTFDETLSYTASQEPRAIVIATNGSIRSCSWWADLASNHKDRLKVIFSIDGLDKTNSEYRVGSSFKKIMANAKAFLDNGGKARWDFIEFKHNFHQIEEAKKRASDMGFQEFNVKYTARFAVENKTRQSSKNNGVLEDRKTNHNQKDFAAVQSQYGSFDQYVNETTIDCKYKRGRKVFVDMNMRLWPCCWFGAPLYLGEHTKQNQSFQHLVKMYGTEFNSLRTHGWGALEHEFFQSYLENSWEKPDDKFQRIYTCGRTCGGKFEFSSGYGRNQNVTTARL